MNGFNGQYDFNIKSILKRAYLLCAQNNWTLVLALLCIVAVTFVIYFIYLDAFEIKDFALLLTEDSPLTQSRQVIINLTLTVILAPLWTGVSMLAIATNRNSSQSPQSPQSPQSSQSALSIFEYYKILPHVALASALISVLVNFGVILFFIPGFYIFTATTFTLPLIADKKLRPIKAIIYSTRMSNLYIWKMLQLYLLFLLMLFVVVISFGFAYLWIGPLYFNAKAILYQDLFCGKLDSANNNQSGQDKGVFNA